LPFPEEEMVQRQLDEDLAIPDSLPRDTTPPSTHEGDIEPSIAPKLPPVASPVGTDYVDEHTDLPGSPQLLHDSPDPLDIITPAEDDSERESSPTHERPEVVQPPSPSQPFEGSDGAISAEHAHSSIAEPPDIAEIHEDQLVESSEVVERSEAEIELLSDGRVTVSDSNPVEGETSTEDRLDMAWKDDISMRHISEPPVDHAVEPPPSSEDTTTSVANTLKTDTPKTESEGGRGTFSSSEADSHLAEVTGTVEVKEEIQPDESQSEEIQVKQDDEMDSEQKSVPKAASPVAEQSRRDRKPWKPYLYLMLTIIQTSGRSQRLRVYSQMQHVTEKKHAKTHNPSTKTNQVRLSSISYYCFLSLEKVPRADVVVRPRPTRKRPRNFKRSSPWFIPRFLSIVMATSSTTLSKHPRHLITTIL
jgi:hypothetical protein